jgi:16S rRNA (guanine527-N7)-methyltransferase
MEDGHRIYFDVITARAYAATDDILSSTAHLQNAATRILVMQGKLDEQINSDQYELVESHVLDVYGLDAERHLLEIKKI